MDISVCVYCHRDIQIQRLMSRDECSLEQAELALENQLDMESKRDRSTFVIDNSGSFDDLENEINLFTQKILRP